MSPGDVMSYSLASILHIRTNASTVKFSFFGNCVSFAVQYKITVITHFIQCNVLG